MSDGVKLEAVCREGGRWVAEVSFRGGRYTMVFAADARGRLNPVERSPFNLTAEGYEVARLVECFRQGESVSLPHRVEPSPDQPRLPSAYDPDWNAPPLHEVWLDNAERRGEARWLARLRLDGIIDVYELEILPGETLRELRTPTSRAFQVYKYDLMNHLCRMHNGERLELPVKLRARLPTPPDGQTLP